MRNKIPTTVFSGFLGSGKTTIISHLIEILQKKGEQVVYIKNEIGETDIDTKILEGKGIRSKELLNGCICCTIVGPFISSINEIVSTFNPDRIIIEASGAADPSAIALMISSHPNLERDGVIAIIDVVNFEGYKDLSVTAQNQTMFTDLIIFNKIEFVDIQKKKTVVGYVRELNTHSPIVEAANGKINPQIVFGLNSSELDSLLAQAHNSHENHIHEDKIQAFTINLDKLFTQETIANFLNKIPKNIFRAKGFITTLENKVYVFNAVGNRSTFAQAPKNFETNNLKAVFVFIGYQADEYRDDIAESLKKLL